MLPDFATMIGAQLPAQSDPALAAGVHFHHESDRAFHGLAEFRQAESWTLQHMLRSGLRRGPARGVAHVGVELCLDGAVVGDRKADGLYLQAIELARKSPPQLADEAASSRFCELAERLCDVGLPIAYRQAEVVGSRLVRILKPRPLLRLAADEEPLLMAAVLPMHERVGAEATSIMAALARAL